jgi:hypothetical protein
LTSIASPWSDTIVALALPTGWHSTTRPTAR